MLWCKPCSFLTASQVPIFLRRKTFPLRMSEEICRYLRIRLGDRALQNPSVIFARVGARFYTYTCVAKLLEIPRSVKKGHVCSNNLDSEARSASSTEDRLPRSTPACMIHLANGTPLDQLEVKGSSSKTDCKGCHYRYNTNPIRLAGIVCSASAREVPTGFPHLLCHGIDTESAPGWNIGVPLNPRRGQESQQKPLRGKAVTTHRLRR